MSSANEPARHARQGDFVRAAVLVSGVVAYQFLVHFSLAHPQGEILAPLLAALPLLLLSVWLLRRANLRSKLAGAALAAAGVVVALSRGVTPAFCYFLVQIAAYAAIFWLFARTLLPGREPLICHIARSVHGALPGEIERYTRRVTWYWSGVLALMGALSTALFALAPLSTWSFFANMLNAPLLAVAFLGEYAWRISRYPRFAHASIFASLRAFRRAAGPRKPVHH